MQKGKKIWVITIIVILNISVFLDVMGVSRPYALHGEKTELSLPQFSFEALYNGSYTDSLSDFLKTNFKLRGIAIRTRNQIDYSLFGETHARSVIMGKEGVLFEESYIKAALGTDDNDSSKIRESVTDLDSLASALNIPVFVVLAPGKASYYLDFIPNHYLNGDSINLNRSYENWREGVMKSESLQLVDLHSHFIDKEEVFPQNGIHWCEWAQIEAFNIINDSLRSYLPDGIEPSSFIIDSVYRSTTMEGTDEDIEKGLNLWQNIDDFETTYYKTSWEEIEKNSKPKVLVVGDSYAWGVVNRGILKHGYRDGEFWYYNQVVHGPAYMGTGNFGGNPLEIHSINSRSDLVNVLNDFDAIILLSTDANLHKFPFGFSGL
jgi:hypothetical protein